MKVPARRSNRPIEIDPRRMMSDNVDFSDTHHEYRLSVRSNLTILRIELLRKFSQRRLALDGCQCHFALKAGAWVRRDRFAMVPPDNAAS